MPDVLPDDAPAIRWVEEKMREVFALFGYREIETPVLEETEVFTRSIGEETDIVAKEMYSFTDRGGKQVSMRPEGTASVIRSYIEHSMHADSEVVKLFYTGSMFRGERPQKGRLRQFHQVGAEIIGASDPYIDAELILSLDRALKGMGVEGFSILINSLGCGRDRASYKKALSKYLKDKGEDLCDDCRRRTETNVLRVLDCKRPECREVLKSAPSVIDSLCRECLGYYEEVKKVLSASDVNCEERPSLVRGLDYYTGTIFEVVHPSLGAQDAIAAGGRYDDLTKQMGGPDVSATGYAIGVERLLLVIDRKNVPAAPSGVLVVPLGTEARMKAFNIAGELRSAGIPSEMATSDRSLKAHMRRADKDKRRHVIIIGEDELTSGRFILKDMTEGTQEQITLDRIIEVLGTLYQLSRKVVI